MKTISTRQWILYKYLLKRSRRGLWTTREQIMNDLFVYYPLPDNITEKDKSYNIYYDTNAKLLTSDIRALNDSDSIQKIILCNSKKGIKIGTKKECEEQLERDKISTLKRLKRIYDKYRKTGLHHQMKIDFGCDVDYYCIDSFINTQEKENDNG